MAEPDLDSVHLHRCLDRMQAGDAAAGDELLRAAARRLELLAHKMLRGFPNVRRWAEADDVLQNAVLRLLHSLEKVRPPSTRDFFNLAAAHLRRELLDLARHFDGPLGDGANLARTFSADFDDPAGEDDAQLERWRAFHEAVEGLPAAEREVVGLAFYHGWTHTQIAGLLHVSERTVRRLWQSACRKLHADLGEPLRGREWP
jgi:RNA polymerase sigma-70 factor (ECF subfamily)